MDLLEIGSSICLNTQVNRSDSAGGKGSGLGWEGAQGGGITQTQVPRLSDACTRSESSLGLKHCFVPPFLLLKSKYS